MSASDDDDEADGAGHQVGDEEFKALLRHAADNAEDYHPDFKATVANALRVARDPAGDKGIRASYAYDATQMGFHANTIKQLERLGDRLKTGIATQNDSGVRALLEAHAFLKQQRLDTVRRRFVPNVADKSFICGAADGQEASALIMVCLEQDAVLGLKFAEGAGGGDGGLDAAIITKIISEIDATVDTGPVGAYKAALRNFLATPGNYLLRWEWRGVAVSVLRGTKAPIKKLRYGEDTIWSDVASREHGTTGPAAVRVYNDEESPLRVCFASAHITFSLRFDDYDEEECELPLFSLLGATEEEDLVEDGFAVISLKPKSGGDKRAGLDVAGDGRLKRRGREGGLKTKEAFDVVKAGGSLDAKQEALLKAKGAATKRQADAAAGAAAKKTAVAAASANVEKERNEHDAAAARSDQLDDILGL